MIMDPDATLAMIREIIAHADRRGADYKLDHGEANEVADHFRDLDRWLSSGGFLPAAWRQSVDVV